MWLAKLSIKKWDHKGLPEVWHLLNVSTVILSNQVGTNGSPTSDMLFRVRHITFLTVMIGHWQQQQRQPLS